MGLVAHCRDRPPGLSANIVEFQRAVEDACPYKYTMKLLYNSEFRVSDNPNLYPSAKPTPNLFTITYYLLPRVSDKPQFTYQTHLYRIL